MKYNILDAEGGNVINTILADADFVAANFDHYEVWVAPTPTEPTAEEAARLWRNAELEATDYIVPLSDHPQRAAYMTYRTALRDWPSTSDFPDTKPTLGS
tara:strand:- start:543 stop:842 length:300 start_codon:yes stop_codon:yes gene_type:complete